MHVKATVTSHYEGNMMGIWGKYEEKYRQVYSQLEDF